MLSQVRLSGIVAKFATSPVAGSEIAIAYLATAFCLRRIDHNYFVISRTFSTLALQDKCMKQKIKASICVPVQLRSLLKQNAARKNMFLGEYIALLLLNDLDPQHRGQIGEVAQTSLSRVEGHQQETVLAGSSVPQETHE
jgi:hypothetical protein